MSDLAGRTVVVTRAEDDSDSLRLRLEELGARVFLFPCIAIRRSVDDLDLEVALDHLREGRAGWIAFASRNAVRAFLDECEARGVTVEESVRLAAIGPGTASLLSDRLRRPDLVPERSVAEELARAIVSAGPPDSGTVLVPAAREGRQALVEVLARAGFAVHRFAVYETIVGDPGDGARLPRPVDAVLFTSPSTVRGFFLRAAWPPEAVAISIGPSTTQRLRSLGVERLVEAGAHDLGGLIEAVIGTLSPATRDPSHHEKRKSPS
jgi:uroporphyrinogen-III synthase